MGWDELYLRDVLLSNFEGIVVDADLLSEIRASSLQCVRAQGTDDERLWGGSLDGVFSIKSCYDMLCSHDDLWVFHSTFWDGFVPSKLGVFFWRLVQGVILVNVVVQRCHILLVSKYLCCVSVKIETISHLFLDIDLARMLWSWLCLLFRIPWPWNSSLNHLLMLWFHAFSKRSQIGMLSVIIPIVVCWVIWLELNDRRFKSISHDDWFVKRKVLKWITDLNGTLIPKKKSVGWFGEVCSSLFISLSPTPSKSICLVTWRGDDLSDFIPNTDGASVDDLVAEGGVIHSSNGSLLGAFYSFYGEGSNNVAETRAILDGIRFYDRLGFFNVLLQSDSALVIRWFQGNCSIPWHLARYWQEIHHVSSVVSSATNVYRQAN
ncbi:Reverse transcriptase zinc-binding domain [Macleaya cordata]|uniref:Reverse transcriptase zinc-binding domain n=1 Tax=Macleaya cordata TaxID=56857 RepID=A0A200QSP4_MACCD|nr:Reverse transcriptase zinc-binding domain [Macleaya cordata]